MAKRLVLPPAFAAAERLKLSPGILSGSHLFLTGVIGGNPQGMPDDPEEQFRAVFEKIRTVLAEIDLTFDAVVEMTSYHVGIREHFDLFDRIRLEYVTEPYPAWTAIEAGGLRRQGALVEVRVIATTDP